MAILKKFFEIVVAAIQYKCSKCGAKTSTPNDFASCPKGGHHNWKLFG